MTSTFWLDLLGAEVRYTDPGGVRTRSIRAGTGEPLVLLHGIGATAETFARNITALSKHFSVHAIDLLGHGGTSPTAGALSRDAFLAHIVDYMDEASIAEAHVAGLSLGGWLATWMALAHPSRVKRFINIVGPYLRVPVDEESRAQALAGVTDLQRLTQAFVANPTRETLRARLGWAFHAPERDVTDELLELRWRMNAAATNGRQIAAFIGNAAPEDLLTPERLRSIDRPAMFLWTDHNPSASAAEGKAGASYVARSEFVLMRDCGHWPQWEDSATFNRLVTDFLTDRPSAVR